MTRRPGRPTILTDEVALSIAQHIAEGHAVARAAVLAGVADATYFNWARLGRLERERVDAGAVPDPAMGSFLTLFDLVETARAEAAAAKLARRLAAQTSPATGGRAGARGPRVGRKCAKCRDRGAQCQHADSTEGDVYYAYRAGFVKIGKSVEVEARLRTLERVGGVVMPPGVAHGPLELLATHPGGRAAERQVHRTFAHLWVCGEWFRDAPELREHIDRINAGVLAA